jgi:hypothetical protein
MARALGELLLPLSRGHPEGDRALGSAGASISDVQPVERTQPVDCHSAELLKTVIEKFNEWHAKRSSATPKRTVASVHQSFLSR